MKPNLDNQYKILAFLQARADDDIVHSDEIAIDNTSMSQVSFDIGKLLEKGFIKAKTRPCDTDEYATYLIYGLTISGDDYLDNLQENSPNK